MTIGKLLTTGLLGGALIVMAGSFQANAQEASVDALAQVSEALAGDVAALQAQNQGTTAQKTKLAQIARGVTGLRGNITAAAPGTNPDEVNFLTDEFVSLQAQFVGLKLKIGPVCAPATGASLKP